MSASVFKIRRKSDGLFSSGGAYPKWSERGKSWSTLGAAKSAVALLNVYFSERCNVKHRYCDCEIVEFALQPYRNHPIEITNGKAVWPKAEKRK
jgi:hypothetical protein